MIALLLTLVVIGLLVYLLQMISMPANFKSLIEIVAIIFAILLVIQFVLPMIGVNLK